MMVTAWLSWVLQWLQYAYASRKQKVMDGLFRKPLRSILYHNI